MFEDLKKGRMFRIIAQQLLRIAADADNADDREILEETAREYDAMAEAQSKSLMKLHS